MSRVHLSSWLSVARGFLLAFTLLIAASSHSAQILAIDLAGNIHSVDPETGNFETLFGTNLSRARGLDRTPAGDLYTTSLEDGRRQLYKIDENNFSTQPIGGELAVHSKEFSFQSDAVALVTTDIGPARAVLLKLDLPGASVESIGFLGTDFDITALEIRSDGALVGIQVDHSDGSGSAVNLVEINPRTAELRTIANLSGVNARDLGGIVTTERGAYFVSSSANGVVSHFWSLDLYSGEHSLRSTVVGIEGIVGVALPIPEPGSALLTGLGLFCLSAIRKNRRNAYGVLALLLAFSAQPAIGTEIPELLAEACESGELSSESCSQLWSCLEDPEGCSAGSNGAMESLPSIEPFEGEEGAMIAPVSGSSIAFRAFPSESPMISPDGNWVGFEDLNGPKRVHRAVFGDGSSAGVEMQIPAISSSVLLGGIDNLGIVSGSSNTSPPNPTSQSYIATTSVTELLPLVDANSVEFELSGAFDVDANSTRIAGSVYDANVGTFGKNYPAIWSLNAGVYELRRFNGLTASTSWTVARLIAITPDGAFAVGFGGSTSVPAPSGTQAFRLNRLASSFAGLPFLPSATNNFSEALAISNSATVIVGRATNSTVQNVATAWTQVSGNTYTANELPRFGSATSSTARAVAGDGSSFGGSVGSEAAVWNGSTFEVHRLADILAGIGLTVPIACPLTNVTDMNLDGHRLVGEATCGVGAGAFKQVFEIEVPFSVPEPDLVVSVVVGAGALACWGSGRRSRASQ